MVIANILTLFYSQILYSTYYFQTYKVLITTIEIKSKIKQKNTLQSSNLHNYCLCNDLKTKLDHIILEKNKIHETKLNYSIKVLFHQNQFLVLTH